MTTHSQHAARKFYQILDATSTGQADLAALDDILADHFQAHQPGGVSLNREGFKELRQSFMVAFPGSTHTIEDVIAEENRVALRVTWHGKHTGPFQSAPATNNSFEVSTMAVMSVEDGKVTELWPLFDSMTFMTSVGLVKQ